MPVEGGFPILGFFFLKKRKKKKPFCFRSLSKFVKEESNWGTEIAQDCHSVTIDLIETEIELSPQSGPAEELVLSRLRRRFAR
jgi:hypothetical protein